MSSTINQNDKSNQLNDDIINENDKNTSTSITVITDSIMINNKQNDSIDVHSPNAVVLKVRTLTHFSACM